MTWLWSIATWILSRLFGGGDKTVRNDDVALGAAQEKVKTLEAENAEIAKQAQAIADAPGNDAEFDSVLDAAASRARSEGRP